MIVMKFGGSSVGAPDRIGRVIEIVRGRLARKPVVVVTGFIGRTRGGELTTLGRNGSDFTETIIGAALGAEEVEIWSDVDGIMTADPAGAGSQAARGLELCRGLRAGALRRQGPASAHLGAGHAQGHSRARAQYV